MEDTMNKPNSKKRLELAQRRDAPLATRTDLSVAAAKDISGTMNAILADVFALYVKTKNFHWHSACSITMPNTSSHWTCSPN